MLNWLRPFGTFCFLDNHDYCIAPHTTDCLVGVAPDETTIARTLNEIDGLVADGQWAFGHLCYEANHALYGLPTTKNDPVGFPHLQFFVPQIVLVIQGYELTIHAPQPAQVWEEILATVPFAQPPTGPVVPQPQLSKPEYINGVEALRRHILRGDCYEANFCQAFVAEEAEVDPFSLFERLMAVSPNPFSAFYRLGDRYLLCASPERFLKKWGSRIFSQPIKGTTGRNFLSAEEDQAQKQWLRQSAKDQAENVMVVDLVRNDLTRICEEATVQVDELFGIYSFPQVHQMITTVSGEMRDGVSFSEIMTATFPMGSMTGAPKQRVMELIDEYEPAPRGIFSGAVGYITPAGDFDLAVVIRSIMYNKTMKRLCYQVGSGITFYSDAEKEWEECMLKAEAIRSVLGG